MSEEFPPIIQLLPHRPPMLLLRSVLSHSGGETVCEARIDPEFAAACGGAAPAAFGLELIAQAAAVHHGLALRHRPTEQPTRGLLLGSRRLQLECRELPTDQPLRVVVLGGDALSAAQGLIRFEGRVEDETGRILARGDVTVLESSPKVAIA